MLSVAREGPNDRRGVDGRASMPSKSACRRAFSRGLTQYAAFPHGFVQDGPPVERTALGPEGAALR